MSTVENSYNKVLENQYINEEVSPEERLNNDEITRKLFILVRNVFAETRHRPEYVYSKDTMLLRIFNCGIPYRTISMFWYRHQSPAQKENMQKLLADIATKLTREQEHQLLEYLTTCINRNSIAVGKEGDKAQRLFSEFKFEFMDVAKDAILHVATAKGSKEAGLNLDV